MKKTILLSLAVMGMLAFNTTVGIASDEENKEQSTTRLLTLEEIQKNPESYKGTKLIFRAQFNRFSDVYSPFYTIFSSSSYLNFSVWPYDAQLWVKSLYKSDFPYLYVDKKDRKLCEVMMETKQYTRVEITCEIRSTFNGIPWMQVNDVKEVPRMLDRSIIGHMARGFSYKKKGDHVKASLEFGRAWSDTAPVEVQYLARKEAGRSLFTIGSYAESVTALEHAMEILTEELNGKDEETEFLLKEAYGMVDYEEMLTEQRLEGEEEWEETEEEEWIEEPETREEETVKEPQPEEEEVVEESEEVEEETVEEPVEDEEDDW